MIKLAVPILINSFLAIILYSLDKYSKFRTMKNTYKQGIIGILFGLVACFSTEFGFEHAGTIINVRDASPLCAGLIFGGPAGIIAGAIGGIYRWLCVYWGGGEFSRLACSLSVFIIGIITALVRKYMFDNKKPTWSYCIGIALVGEVFHMLMIFLLKISDTAFAFHIVSVATVPMMLSNALAVGISLIAITIISKERPIKQKKQIATTFQHWLLLCITIAFVITSLFTFALQNNSSRAETKSILNLALGDVNQDIIDAADKNLLEVAYEIKGIYENSNELSSDELLDISNKFNVIGINIIDEDNIIVNSCIKNFIGFDMNSGDQSREFVDKLKQQDEYVQKYQPLTIDETFFRKYAAIKLKDGGFIQVGYNGVQLQEKIDEIVVDITKNRHIGKTGFIAICDDNFRLVSDIQSYKGQDVRTLGFNQHDEDKTNEVYETFAFDKEYLYSYTISEGYYIIGAIPKSEAMFMRNISIYLTIFMEIIIFSILFVLIYLLIKLVIINNLNKVNMSLSKITHGDLEEVVNVRTNDEFASLSDDINETVNTLKKYIDEASSRIDKELSFAKSIQQSALPSVFPAYPNDKEFNIYAQMYAAKQVGGDFYDFYKVGSDKLLFLIADVSGKGIPAAMFMMKAKAVIKSLAESGRSVEEIFNLANKDLCENNDSGMFVTSWLGMLNIKTGEICYVNAGHNPPVINKADGETYYLKSRAGFVLGGFDTVKYKENKLTLSKGDRILLYTDGVTEATNTKEELFGEDRLLEFIKANDSLDIYSLLDSLKKDIDTFAMGTEQFDDITTVVLELGKNNEGFTMEQKVFNADIAELENVLGFLESKLEQYGCSMKLIYQLNLAIEEVFVNIAHYAYPNDTGTIDFLIGYNEQDSTVHMTISDYGVKFNPLNKPDPDITLSAEERQIGGLGIFICKKTMDEIYYEYKENKNILLMKKIIK